LHCSLRFIKSDDATIQPSLLRLNGDLVELAALKKAEDSNDIILRLYEPHGSRANTTIETAGRLRNASLVNILETSDQLLAVEGEHRIKLSFRPFQVVSLKLEFAE
jgi:alpha-mannosidase